MNFYTDPMATLYQGHVLDVLAQLPEESVNCVVTSPPYWGLRKYAGDQDRLWDNHNGCEHEFTTTTTISNNNGGSGSTLEGRGTKTQGVPDGKYHTSVCLKCGAWRGAYGLEPTIALYVQHTITVLQAIKRVLRKDGVVWWNVGDSYASNPTASTTDASTLGGGKTTQDKAIDRPNKITDGLKPKDLCLIPSRVALAAQDDGWWVRSLIVWSKPNPMPESVTDRPTDAYENIIMLTKSRTYWYDGDAVKENYSESYANDSRHGSAHLNHTPEKDYDASDVQTPTQLHDNMFTKPMGTGRNLRNVWEITTQPYKEAHFATFPEKIPERCILASCPQDGTVLEPFAGSGTTLAVAKRLGSKSIGIELSEQYCKLAVKRIQAVTLPLCVAGGGL